MGIAGPISYGVLRKWIVLRRRIYTSVRLFKNQDLADLLSLFWFRDLVVWLHALGIGIYRLVSGHLCLYGVNDGIVCYLGFRR